jgi:Flp pilus assembly protein TadD
LKTSNSDRQSIWLESWHPYIILLAVVALVYGRTLSFGYTHFDDDILILDQFDKLRQPSMILEAFRSLFLRVYYRPIVTLSLVFDARIGGQAPWIYHSSNLLYHAIVCLILFTLLRRFSVGPIQALMASLLFALHPVVTQAVAWIPGRNDTLVTLFLLLSLIAYMNYRESGGWHWIVVHWMFAGISMLTKETALIFPAMILSYHFIIERDSWKSRRLLISAGGWAFLVAGWYLLQRSVVGGRDEHVRISLSSILTNVRVPLEAMGKLAFPVQLSPYPTYSLLPTIAGIVAVAVFTMILVRRSKTEDRLQLFAIALMLLFLLPGLFVQFEDNEQRFDYLESRWYGVALGFAVLITDLMYRRGGSARSFGRKLLWAALPVLGVLTFMYTGTFSDPLTHWRRAVEMSPQASQAYFKMGLTLSNLSRDPAQAAEWYRKAIKLDPNIAMYHNNVGVLYGAMGLQSQAMEEYRTAIKLDSTYLSAYGNLGYSEFLSGNYAATEQLWNHILAVDSTFPNVEFQLARLYATWKKYPEARYHIQKLQERGVPLDSLLSTVPRD